MRRERTYLDAFRALHGREPTDAEWQRAFRLIDSMGLDETDDLAKGLMLIGYMEAMAERIPNQLRAAASDTMDQARESADRVIAASAAKAQAELAEAVSSAANKVAKDVAGREKWSAVRWALCVAFCVVAAMAALAFNVGHQLGIVDAHAKDWLDRAKWANTDEGILAKSLAEVTDVRQFAQCTRKGWIKEATTADGRLVCFPGLGQAGWYLPIP